MFDDILGNDKNDVKEDYMFDDILGNDKNDISVDFTPPKFCGSFALGTTTPSQLLHVRPQYERVPENTVVPKEDYVLVPKTIYEHLLQDSDITFAKARITMNNTFIDDPDFLRVYVDSIAMLLYDNQNGCDGGLLNFKEKETRDLIATSIMRLIFS
jgi:hypothetical protein